LTHLTHLKTTTLTLKTNGANTNTLPQELTDELDNFFGKNNSPLRKITPEPQEYLHHSLISYLFPAKIDYELHHLWL